MRSTAAFVTGEGGLQVVVGSDEVLAQRQHRRPNGLLVFTVLAAEGCFPDEGD